VEELMFDHDPAVPLDDLIPVDTFDISGAGGHYRLDWPRLNIQAEVSHFNKERDSSLSAEVEFRSQRPSANASGHVLRRRVNLSNPSAPYVKSLTEEDESLGWKHIVDQLCVAATDAYRTGAPETELVGQIKASPEGHWLIRPLVQIGHPTLIYGEGSSGKSWLGQYLSVLVHEGINASGLEVSQARVLYLDWETDLNEIGSRLAMIRKGLGLPERTETGIWYKYMTQGLSSDVSVVRKIVQDRNIQFVVCDSLGSACMGEPESAEVVLKLFGAIRSLGVTSLCIDHTNKSDVLFGSVYKRNASRLVYHVKKSQREQDVEFEMAMFHEKANNSRLIGPMGWNLQFDNVGGMATFTRRDVKHTRLESEMTVKERIKNYLEESIGAQSVADIAEALGKGTTHISKELSDNKDMFRVVSKGFYENIRSESEEWAARSIPIPPPGATEWEV
jgi:hypothetical protein